MVKQHAIEIDVPMLYAGCCQDSTAALHLQGATYRISTNAKNTDACINILARPLQDRALQQLK